MSGLCNTYCFIESSQEHYDDNTSQFQETYSECFQSLSGHIAYPGSARIHSGLPESEIRAFDCCYTGE